MPFLDPRQLPHEFPRRYLPPSAALEDWPSVEPFFQELENRGLSSKTGLENWLRDLGEFQDALDEEGTLRYIRMTCRTDDPETGSKYVEFLEQVSEPSKSRFFSLLKKYRDCPHRQALPNGEFFLFNRSVENQLALYREENIPLETELEKLSQHYRERAVP